MAFFLFFLLRFIMFSLLTHILCFFWSLAIFLITSWFFSVLCLSVSYLSISLSVFLPASVYLYISFLPPTLREGCSWLFDQSNRWGPVKAPNWCHLASLQVIMKCTDMLICTKPTLLMKIQYWLPFIRLIMKYQYHLLSYSASVNRASNECLFLQTHLDPVTSI